MRLYFDVETSTVLQPTLGQQIQLQEQQQIGNNDLHNLMMMQSTILDDAVNACVSEVFDLTKKKRLTGTETKTELNAEENEIWKSRYITQISTFIRKPNVYTVHPKHWQISQATELLRARAYLPHLPQRHTLPVTNVCLFYTLPRPFPTQSPHPPTYPM